MIEKHCVDCRYGDGTIDNEPCIECHIISSPSHWEPRPSCQKAKLREAIKELERRDDEIYNDPEAIKRAEELGKKLRGLSKVKAE